MIRRVWLASLLLITCFLIPAFAETSSIQKSLARISNTVQDYNYRTPWLPGPVGGGTGTGWVVGKDRLMTNAHVVSNSRLLTVEKENDPRKYVATVEYIAHDCDLAVLKVEDPDFWKGTKPLPLGGVPEVESTVSVYGYPIGGDRMSVTRGVVSRVDFRTYSHSVMDSHLCIQIDAAINPGNSGGPVLQNGKVVGVAFQGFSGDVAQNVGYMIPIPVVSHFLKDISDGHYDRYMDLGVSIFPLQNRGHRQALGLIGDDRGVLVSSVPGKSVAAGKLQVGDVLLAVDGIEIESDGYVTLGADRVMMAEVAERKYKGDKIVFKLIRDGKTIEETVVFNEAWPFTFQAQSYAPPRYVLFAGQLFQPLNRNLLIAYKFTNQRIHFMYGNFVEDEMYKDRDEIIVLTSLLPDSINTYNDDMREEIVDKVNGKKIRNLKEFSEALSDNVEEHVVEFLGFERPLVMERAKVEAARDRIKQRYRVTSEQRIEEVSDTK